MDTNSKNKNKLRIFIAIAAMLIVTAGAVIALHFILNAKDRMDGVDPGSGYMKVEGAFQYFNGRKMQIYKKVVNGREIEYCKPENYYNTDALTQFLAEYGQLLVNVLVTVLMALLVLFLRSKRIWKQTECANRKGIWYVAEVLVIALGCLPGLYSEINFYVNRYHSWQAWSYDNWKLQLDYITDLARPVFTMLLFIFLCFWFLRPLFSLGVRAYLKEYSLLCLVGRAIRKVWRRFKAELNAIDFGKKSIKVLWKGLLIQFVILCLCACCWFVGIPLLAIYSVALFFFLRRCCAKTECSYNEVLRETKKIADGDLEGTIEGNLGMFAPMGEELGEIKVGFRKAVDAETKSQRMKTELITNVSHDLKTPLTAIMTYVELLKNEEITPEERASYVETLDKKSKRLKVLIEDLFEVSKAASNTVALHPTEVDMGQLVRQVAVEYEERFQDAELQLRKEIAEERLPVWADGQKTCRILENLFSNTCKYAMPGSRVYLAVKEDAGKIVTVLKNTSAAELTINGDEITERFVRGDESRNTEGSGLGLAIAKNLTEAQGGSFHVDIDGDLFKTTMCFMKYTK